MHKTQARLQVAHVAAGSSESDSVAVAAGLEDPGAAQAAPCRKAAAAAAASSSAAAPKGADMWSSCGEGGPRPLCRPGLKGLGLAAA